MQIRRARPDDLASVGAVTLAAYQPFLLGPDDGYAEELGNAEARDLQAQLWVAIDGDDGDDGESGEVLGTVTLCPDGSPWREVALADEGEFRMLAVAPSAQGRGVGSALVRHCLDRCREQGASAVVLSSLDDMTAAHRLYARHGFERLPERDWEPRPGTRLLAFGAVLGV